MLRGPYKTIPGIINSHKTGYAIVHLIFVLMQYVNVYYTIMYH